MWFWKKKKAPKVPAVVLKLVTEKRKFTLEFFDQSVDVGVTYLIYTFADGQKLEKAFYGTAASNYNQGKDGDAVAPGAVIEPTAGEPRIYPGSTYAQSIICNSQFGPNHHSICDDERNPKKMVNGVVVSIKLGKTLKHMHTINNARVVPIPDPYQQLTQEIRKSADKKRSDDARIVSVPQSLGAPYGKKETK